MVFSACCLHGGCYGQKARVEGEYDLDMNKDVLSRLGKVERVVLYRDRHGGEVSVGVRVRCYLRTMSWGRPQAVKAQKVFGR